MIDMVPFDVQLVIITAAVKSETKLPTDQQFIANANIIREITCGIAHNCSGAFITVATNPINSLVPVAAEVLKACGVFDEKKLFGVSALATIRARSFLSQTCGIKTNDIEIPIIGGHSKDTTVPLLSASNVNCSMDNYGQLVKHVKEVGSQIIQSKHGIPHLAMSYATAKFANCLCMAMNGKSSPILSALVKSDLTDAKYFCSPIVVGKDGITDYFNIPKLNTPEDELLQRAMLALLQQIKIGEKFIENIANSP